MHGKDKKTGRAGPALHIDVFNARTVVPGLVFDSVESTIVNPEGGQEHSSYPHLTHATLGKEARKAHITSSRVVAVTPTYVIHQRFHQNDDGLSEPTHDRYFSVDQATGVVSGASAAFTPNVHKGKNDALPMRGTTLAESAKVHTKMTFTVGTVDDKHPPLSPRSRLRQLPDTGHKP